MKCSFCNNNIEAGTGVMFVKNDGKIFYFCSKKCEKNMLKLKREPKNVKWVTKKIKK
jgi:large subunit ribosomal protein L24e